MHESKASLDCYSTLQSPPLLLNPRRQLNLRSGNPTLLPNYLTHYSQARCQHPQFSTPSTTLPHPSANLILQFLRCKQFQSPSLSPSQTFPFRNRLCISPSTIPREQLTHMHNHGSGVSSQGSSGLFALPCRRTGAGECGWVSCSIEATAGGLRFQ
jgi:hypothetical protein